MGQPYALWWNLLGFLAVGILLAGFGLVYGAFLRDRAVEVLLALFGVGFGATGVPIDLERFLQAPFVKKDRIKDFLTS